MNEADAALAALKETRNRTAAEFRRTTYDELAKAEQKAAGIAQDVIKAQRRTSLQDLTAPVDGVVQQLAVHTVGGVVTPAQPLAVIVPTGSQLEIEATLANDDVGFVHEGQDVEIKVHTFNFTRYGLLHGRVLSVSSDAVQRDGGAESRADRTRRKAASSRDKTSFTCEDLARSTADGSRRAELSISGPAWR